VKVTGGTPPYTYLWNTLATQDSIKHLFPYTYRVLASDANGCPSNSAQLKITQPDPVVVTPQVFPSTCNARTGSITLKTSGGTAPYQYSWTDNSTASSIHNLGKGIYKVTITDAHNCKLTSAVKLDNYVPQAQICMVTVDSGYNRIVWDPAVNALVKQCNVFRWVGGTYQKLGTVLPTNYSTFIDALSTPDVVASRYVISTEDSCGNTSPLSFAHQTIYLGASMGVNGTSTVLDWTPYIDEGGDFIPTEYKLYRGTRLDKMEYFASVSVGTEYTDADPRGSVYYMVSVEKKPDCISKLKSDGGPYSQSLSNIAESKLLSSDVYNSQAQAVFPNPVSRFVTISMPVQAQAISVVSVAGRIVFETNPGTRECMLDVSFLEPGFYTVNVVTANGLSQYPLIKE
jgi:hypothetical protein